MDIMNIKMRAIFLALLSLTAITTNKAYATPYCHACPFSCDNLQLGHKDCSLVQGGSGSCCVDLTQKGLSRAQEYDQRANAAPRWQQNERQDTCPPGYQPSEQKCRPEERRHGCKDIRLNSGLGCVHR